MLNGRNDQLRGYDKKKQNLSLPSLVLFIVAGLSGPSFKVLAEPPCNAEPPFEVVLNKAAETDAALKKIQPDPVQLSTNPVPNAYKISPEQQKIRNDGIWSRITSRSTGRIYRLFAEHSKVVTVGGTEINVAKEFGDMMYAAESCDEKVLSLGEGRSTLISGLLHEKETLLKMWTEQMALEGRATSSTDCWLSNIHAVDVAYPQHDVQGIITDKRVADKGTSAGLDKYDYHMVPLIKKYPRNYHSQLFQELDLRDENGKRMLFTKIISNYALGYVLEIKEIPEEVRLEMLDRVIDHLAPGGKLIIFPMTLSKEDPFGPAFYNRLAELRKNKIISDYAVHEKNGVGSWVLVK